MEKSNKSRSFTKAMRQVKAAESALNLLALYGRFELVERFAKEIAITAVSITDNFGSGADETVKEEESHD